MAKRAAAKGPKKPRSKKRAAAQPAEATERAATPFNAISPQKLQRLVKDKLAVKRAVSREHTGPLGQRIKEAVDKDKLDRSAFNFIVSLWELDDVTLSHKLANLYYYLDASGLEARAQNAPQMDLGDGATRNGGGGEEEDGGEGEGDGEDDGSLPPASADAAANVTKLHS